MGNVIWFEWEINFHHLFQINKCSFVFVFVSFFNILEVIADGCFYQKALWRYRSALFLMLSAVESVLCHQKFFFFYPTKD